MQIKLLDKETADFVDEFHINHSGKQHAAEYYSI